MGLLLIPSSLTGTAARERSLSSAGWLQSGRSRMLTKCMLMEVTRNYSQRHHLSIARGSFDYLLLLLKALNRETWGHSSLDCVSPVINYTEQAIVWIRCTMIAFIRED